MDPSLPWWTTENESNSSLSRWGQPLCFVPAHNWLNWYLFVSDPCRSEPPLSWCSVRHRFLHRFMPELKVVNQKKTQANPNKKDQYSGSVKEDLKLLIRKALPPLFLSHPVIQSRICRGKKRWGWFVCGFLPYKLTSECQVLLLIKIP